MSGNIRGGAVAALPATPPGPVTEGPVVLMSMSAFCPSRLKVRAGRTMRWINVDRRASHSIWFRDAGRSDSGRLFPEEDVDMVIDLPAGGHRYICAPHWNEGVVAKIMIERQGPTVANQEGVR